MVVVKGITVRQYREDSRSLANRQQENSRGGGPAPGAKISTTTPYARMHLAQRSVCAAQVPPPPLCTVEYSLALHRLGGKPHSATAKTTIIT